MPKYLKQSNGLRSNPNPKQNNAAAAQSGTPSLVKMRKRVFMQAGLALLTIMLTVIIIFAMSAAWYTNIVQTNGLVFEVKEWGFNGEITTNTDPIQAGPGDDGLIALSVKSNSDEICSVSVAVTKAKMPTEIQKRIYFYVDAQVGRNEETMDRLYLNSQDSYTYTLFSQGVLTLSDTFHNDNPIKWQWVYDVLGYYVLGSSTSTGDVMITEYLRPIEYDYDSATMEYVTQTDEEGNEILTMELKTVDGEMTLEEFLVELSKSDGYEGEIDPTEKLVSGYYPVAVDENGTGVYAYLCNYAEIEWATQYDTMLGDAAAAGETEMQYEATLTVSAQKNKNSTVSVASLSALNMAIESGAADVIQLTGDITVSGDEALVIAAGQQTMLDLNGNRIIYAADAAPENAPIQVEPGSSLTLSNGTITTELADSGYAIKSVGAEVTLSNITMTGFESVIRVEDDAESNTTAADSVVRLIGCDLNTTGNGIAVLGNGSDSVQLTQLIIDRTKLVSNGFAIYGNGTITNGGRYGTDIQILNSEITSVEDSVTAAIYQPQPDSNLTIYNSKMSGYTGIALKGGSLYVIDSTIEGLGAQTIPTSFPNSGFTDTGDAIYIETNYGYNIRLEISGTSVLSSTHGYALQTYEPGAKNAKIRIYGGTFDLVPDADLFATYVDSGSVCDMMKNEANGMGSDCRVTVAEPAAQTETETTAATGETNQTE